MFTNAQIRRIREMLEISQRVFAERLGVTQMTVYRWENGQAQPNSGSLAGIYQLVDSELVNLKEKPLQEAPLRSTEGSRIKELLMMEAIKSIAAELHQLRSEVAKIAQNGRTSSVSEKSASFMGVIDEQHKSVGAQDSRKRNRIKSGSEEGKLSTAEVRRNYQRRYYQMHKEKAKEYQRQYNLTHKKKLRARTAQTTPDSPREVVKTTFDTTDIMNSPVEKTIKILEKIIKGERFFTM